MAKLTLEDIVSGYGTAALYNANNALIEAAVEKTLSRDGTTPNTMSAPLDMNSQRIINLPAPVDASDAARLTDVQAALAGGSANLITNIPAGTIAATTVQAAINELDTDVTNHVNDTTAAHAGTSIANTPASHSIATTIQAAVNELDTDLLFLRQSFVKNWSTQSSSEDMNWYGIAWSPTLKLFAAVGGPLPGNRVMTSPDGINWTSRTAVGSGAAIWTRICWSPELGLFCAVASAAGTGSIMTSPDGITWTLQTAPNTNSLLDVCWSPKLSLFVTVAMNGTGNRVNTSPDGINWTARTTPSDILWDAVIWSPELNLFVATADAAGSANNVMTSPNGINWTLRTSAGDKAWRSIDWSPYLGRFVAVSTGVQGAMYSDNGINWQYSNATPGVAWRHVVWAAELRLFVAVAESAVDGIMSSPDGITWTRHNAPVNNAWYGIAWAPEIMTFACVAFSGVGNRVMISSVTGLPIAATVANTPAGNIAATNVQAAINELDSEKAGLALSNTFTASIQKISHTSPRFQLYETDAAADEKLWDLGSASGQLLLRARTDADDAGVNVFTANRTGTNIDAASLIADTINLNGTTLNLQGTATNDNAAAGKYGEYLEANRALGSILSLTTGVIADITTLSLTAGDWDVSGCALFVAGPSTSVTGLRCSIALVTSTLDQTVGRTAGLTMAASVVGIPPNALATKTLRFSLAATTTLYFTAKADFTISTMGVYGHISARRAR